MATEKLTLETAARRVLREYEAHKRAWRDVRCSDDVPIAVGLFAALTDLEGVVPDDVVKPGDLYDAISQALNRSKALADLLALGRECDDDSAMTAAFHLYELLAHARQNLDQFWDQVKPRCNGETPASDGPDFRNLDGCVVTATRLFAHEKRIAQLSLNDVIARYRAFTWDVQENLTADKTEDEYTAKKTWTEKGLRHLLALLEVFEDCCGEHHELQKADQDSGEVTA
jgi:hypothetical protein